MIFVKHTTRAIAIMIIIIIAIVIISTLLPPPPSPSSFDAGVNPSMIIIIANIVYVGVNPSIVAFFWQ